jgi:hypothetical protein
MSVPERAPLGQARVPPNTGSGPLICAAITRCGPVAHRAVRSRARRVPRSERHGPSASRGRRDQPDVGSRHPVSAEEDMARESRHAIPSVECGRVRVRRSRVIARRTVYGAFDLVVLAVGRPGRHGYNSDVRRPISSAPIHHRPVSSCAPSGCGTFTAVGLEPAETSSQRAVFRTVRRDAAFEGASWTPGRRRPRGR